MTIRLNITISKTADGKDDYIQIMSSDGLSINVVMIATEIRVYDTRPKPKKVKL